MDGCSRDVLYEETPVHETSPVAPSSCPLEQRCFQTLTETLFHNVFYIPLRSVELPLD